MRVELPGGPTTTGVWANSAPSGRAPRRPGSWGEYEQELLLSQWVDGQPLAGEREVRRAKLARAVSDQRSYPVGAVLFEDPDFDPRGTVPETANQCRGRPAEVNSGWRCLPAGV
jgi:hypothetical protein